jgi:hypothetical protein
VARVRLYLKAATGSPIFRFARPGAAPDAIPALWLFVYVDLLTQVRPGSRLAARAAYPDCLIDTGCHLSVIPEYIWSHFHPGVVTPLPFDPAMPQRQRSFFFGGGRYPYELGELTVRLTDLDHRTMDVRLVAQLTRDNGALTVPMVLGLRGGALDGRVLRSAPDPGAPFGQDWFLEDP